MADRKLDAMVEKEELITRLDELEAARDRGAQLDRFTPDADLRPVADLIDEVESRIATLERFTGSNEVR